MITGFAPIARADTRVLILGTVPSRRSLEAGQYYAHPRNAFWPIMERLFAHHAGPGDVGPDDAGPATARLDYEARIDLLLAAKVALWDVLRTAERPGSLDADISTPVANDFAAFFARHPAVRTVFFNGTKARALWARHVAPALPGGLGMRLVTLPSTSAANAALTFADKLAAWQVVREAASRSPSARRQP
ncbi:MAG: DNA-deoxyinosine glycosylase [Thermoleophilia bacterium]|nr:DNA-deoxyinosine glycosylase [Thermoleophilia bacterium]